MRNYPHMCRDGHAEIGFAGHSGDCPMCERIAELEAEMRKAADEIERLRERIADLEADADIAEHSGGYGI